MGSGPLCCISNKANQPKKKEFTEESTQKVP